jgi:predicted negative regulator of RcsB-dependent stress response
VLEILRDPAWQSIGVLVALLMAFIGGLGWYIRGRKQRQDVESAFSAQAPPITSVRRVPRQSMERQAQQLLRAIYDLAEGNPGQWVAVAEAVESADLPFTAKDYYAASQYLKQSKLITTDNLVHDEVCRLTPKGIREVEQAVGSMIPPDSMYSPKG